MTSNLDEKILSINDYKNGKRVKNKLRSIQECYEAWYYECDVYSDGSMGNCTYTLISSWCENETVPQGDGSGSTGGDQFDDDALGSDCPSVEQLAKQLNVTVEVFHRDIKPRILGACSPGCNNADICILRGSVWLICVTDKKKKCNTGEPLSSFK